MTRPISHHLAPALLVLGTLLAGGNWYLQRERAVTWMAAIATMAVLALVWGCLTLVFRRSKDEGAWRHADASLRSGIAFGALILVCSLAVKLAAALGAIDDPDLSRRTANVIAGAVLVYVGNGLPKMLTPLSVLQCDGARAQAFQRFAGWTWVLSGLAFATAWMVLPIGLAKPVSLVVLVSGMVIVVAEVVRMSRGRQREA